MKSLAKIMIFMLVLTVTPVWAQQSRTFDWEDGTTTALDIYGNAVLENSAEQAHGGTHSLKLIENPLGGTPQAFVLWVTGLVNGDIINASIWVYDTTPGGSPSGRIWGHYTNNADVTSYQGSASGNGTYSDGSGWSLLSWEWTFETDGTDGREGLVVEARIYSSALDDAIYIDDASITVSSETATIHSPDGSTVPVELMSFSVE